MLSTLAGEKICIEVDGPHHFSTNTLKPSGENLARQRLLQARGWAVASIPFFKWSGKDDDDHVKLLQKVRVVLLTFWVSPGRDRHIWTPDDFCDMSKGLPSCNTHEVLVLGQCEACMLQVPVLATTPEAAETETAMPEYVKHTSHCDVLVEI